MSKVIMTVDDSPSIRQMVAFTLESEGYNVVQAVDGQDALDKLEEKSVNMIITDLNMPNIDGLELIKKVRTFAEYKFTPIIMLTTESHDEKKMAGKSAGATGWIVKPFKPEDLIKVIKKVLR